MTRHRREPAADALYGPPTEVLQGFVIDLHCLRTAPRDTVVQVAARHPRACALAATFSGTPFALVDHDGTVHVLDDAATRLVIAVLWRTDDRRALAVRARRAGKHGRMETVAVSELDWTDRRATTRRANARAHDADGGPRR